jgi:molybdate transport system ATP-binding protein
VKLTLINPAPGPMRARLVGIPARDIMIACERPALISARNVLAAEIEEIHTVESFELVKARLDPALPSVVVEVGRAAVEELALAPGKRVFLIIKAMSCSLYEESASR